MNNNIIKLPNNYELISIECTTSTMDYAKNVAMQSDKSKNTIVIAEQQTNGRGRFSRNWESSVVGNLYCSVVIYPNLWNIKDISKVYEMIFAFSISIAETIEEISLMDKNQPMKSNFVKCKWPNDIYIDNKKAGGILTEVSKLKNEIDFIVIGVGLNIISNPKNIESTCLKLHNINSSVEEILNIFIYRLDTHLRQDFSKIREIWISRAYKFKEVISFSSPYIKNRQETSDSKIEGIFEGINENGSIIINIKNEIITVNMGEIL
ncbi:biotin--[acetyl-CoA-carboxylase] ligase [Candidatus Gromoviella agglomerans]|uniref:biotin--[acetyl-CoA-carboxylase] ligase n=1 Tax=Candidatus Gromoviella agglomerans TaxID=2806609 RepID=UPI001E5ACA9E|nr:biotin--[acetyl-CoA-carboxylase] ligase [Candidatus Gromoviella agglomerans]